MHGTELCKQVRGMLSGSLTDILFRGCPIGARQCTCQPATCSGSVADSGFSLADNDCLFRSHHCRVRVPDLPCCYYVEFPRGPFGKLLRLPAVSGQVGFIAATRCTHFHPTLPAFPWFPLPFRVFRPVRIKAFRQLSSGKPTSRLRPIAFRSLKSPLD